MYQASERPCVLVDAGVTRFKIRDETRDLIEKTGMVCQHRVRGRTRAETACVDLLQLPNGKDGYQ